MNQLDERTRRALCAGDDPGPGVEDRILAAILEPVAGPGGGEGGEGGEGGAGGAADPGPAPSSGVTLSKGSLIHAAKIVGATLGLTAGGIALLAVTASVRNVDVESRKPATTPAARPIRSDAPSPQPTPRPESPRELHELDASPKIVTPAAVPVARNIPRDTSTPDGSIEAELALMQEARGANNPAEALALLDQHRAKFASGVLAAERDVMRVEQLCALGRDDEATALAAEFMRAHPGNPLRSRVERACPAKSRDGFAGDRPLP